MKNFDLILPANYPIKLANPYCKFVRFSLDSVFERTILEDRLEQIYFKSRKNASNHSLEIKDNQLLKIDNIDIYNLKEELDKLEFEIFSILDGFGKLELLDSNKDDLSFEKIALNLSQEFNQSRLKSNSFYREFVKYRPQPIVKLFHFQTGKYIDTFYPNLGIEMGLKNGDFILEFEFIDKFQLSKSYLSQSILCKIKLEQNPKLDEEWHNPYLKNNPVKLEIEIPYYLFESFTNFINNNKLKL